MKRKPIISDTLNLPVYARIRTLEPSLRSMDANARLGIALQDKKDE